MRGNIGNARFQCLNSPKLPKLQTFTVCEVYPRPRTVISLNSPNLPKFKKLTLCLRCTLDHVPFICLNSPKLPKLQKLTVCEGNTRPATAICLNSPKFPKLQKLTVCEVYTRPRTAICLNSAKLHNVTKVNSLWRCTLGHVRLYVYIHQSYHSYKS